MMSAKEMFEKLGFKKCVDNIHFIIYAIKHNENFSDDPLNWGYIRFDKEDKTYYVDIIIGDVDNKLHKAIHKQCHELRWIEND